MPYFVNPVFTILGLILIFFLTAISWVLLNAEFLAFTLILIYVGAVIVLFLFVVMMLEQKAIKIKVPSPHKNKFLVLQALFVTLGLAAIFIFIVENYNLKVPSNIDDNNIYLLGTALFTDYLLPFCMTGMILLSAIIAAICLRDK